MTAMPYVYSNNFTKSWPKVQSFMHALRDSPEGKLPIGAAGFCWGGKHTINLAHGFRTPSGVNLIDAAFTAHPSNLEVPGDIEKVKLPLSIAQPESDMALKPEQYALFREVLGKLEKEENLPWEIVEYKGTTHGFGVRADESKDEAKQAVEAEEQAVKWFQTQFEKVKR
jgi:dienelactone hydrolase